MPLVNTRDMFKRAYEGGYAIGAFNVNNMEIIQGIMEGATAEKAPVILQVSSGARKYASLARGPENIAAIWLASFSEKTSPNCCRPARSRSKGRRPSCSA